MFNEGVNNEQVFNASGTGTFIPGVIVTTPDPGVSFMITDELGPQSEIEDSNGC